MIKNYSSVKATRRKKVNHESQTKIQLIILNFH